MAKEKAGSEVAEVAGDNKVNPRDSGEIGRLQNVKWLVSFDLSHPVWPKTNLDVDF